MLVRKDLGRSRAEKVNWGKVKKEGEGFKYLSEMGASNSWEVSRMTMMRPWGLWCRKVEVNPLCTNGVKRDGQKTA